MNLYTSQKKYFEAAYRSGVHGWPVEGAAPQVLRFVKQFKKKCPVADVLDIGCGEGRHAALFARHRYHTIGLDYEPLALKRAAQFHPNLSPYLRLVVGDLFQMPFRRSRPFDVILDYGCLHHVRKQDTPLYLNNVVPLLKSGGFFLLSCFSPEFRHYPGEKRTRDWLVHRGHYDRFFKKSDLTDIFEKEFDILEIEEERQSLHAFYHLVMRKK